MTAFIVTAGLLLAGALLLILPPLLRAQARQRNEPKQSKVSLTVLREHLAELDAELAAGRIDAATHARSREEVERRALEEGEAAADMANTAVRRAERGWALGLAFSVPVLAVAGYLALGNPDGLDPEKVAGQAGFTPAQVADMVGKLAARLEQEPDNVEGWMMLARSYVVLEDFPKAAAAYERAAALLPGEPDIYADWADVVAVIHGTAVGEAEALTAKALEIAPGHPKALAIAGTAAYQRGDYALAAQQWEKILVQLPADGDFAIGVRNSVNEARAKAGIAPLAAQQAVAPAAATTALKLSGRLEIAPELANKFSPDDAVFVFVRGEGGGPPLAALRFKASELPLNFSFEGAPMMGGDVAVPDRVMVGARVSRGGNASARSGDLEGFTAALAPNASGVQLRIDRQRE